MKRKPERARGVEIMVAHSGTGVARPAGKRAVGRKVSSVKSKLPAPRDFRKLFLSLHRKWHGDVAFVSNYSTIITHPSYYQIIGMGEAALPFIFEDLALGGGPWFVALTAITRADPVKPGHRKDAARMRADWLEWGKTHGCCIAERTAAGTHYGE